MIIERVPAFGAPESSRFDLQAAPCICERLPLLVTHTRGTYRIECYPCGARTHLQSSLEAARSEWAAMNSAANAYAREQAATAEPADYDYEH